MMLVEISGWERNAAFAARWKMRRVRLTGCIGMRWMLAILLVGIILFAGCPQQEPGPGPAQNNTCASPCGTGQVQKPYPDCSCRSPVTQSFTLQKGNSTQYEGVLVSLKDVTGSAEYSSGRCTFTGVGAKFGLTLPGESEREVILPIGQEQASGTTSMKLNSVSGSAVPVLSCGVTAKKINLSVSGTVRSELSNAEQATVGGVAVKLNGISENAYPQLFGDTYYVIGEGSTVTTNDGLVLKLTRAYETVGNESIDAYSDIVGQPGDNIELDSGSSMKITSIAETSKCSKGVGEPCTFEDKWLKFDYEYNDKVTKYAIGEGAEVPLGGGKSIKVLQIWERADSCAANRSCVVRESWALFRMYYNQDMCNVSLKNVSLEATDYDGGKMTLRLNESQSRQINDYADIKLDKVAVRLEPGTCRVLEENAVFIVTAPLPECHVDSRKITLTVAGETRGSITAGQQLSMGGLSIKVVNITEDSALFKKGACELKNQRAILDITAPSMQIFALAEGESKKVGNSTIRAVSINAPASPNGNANACVFGDKYAELEITSANNATREQQADAGRSFQLDGNTVSTVSIDAAATMTYSCNTTQESAAFSITALPQ